MRLIHLCSHAHVPGLTRRLLFAVLATLAPAVAASPAGAAGHTIHSVRANPNVGIVDIYTTLGYENGAAAGTGMILSRTGEVLTNNHVIRSATSFRVVDVTTHKTYSANVVGYSVSRDVAVLQLVHATHLQTIRLGRTVRVRVGQTVVARGNAQGRGGAPKAARGRVTALHRHILARDETGDSETLSNVIATNAAVEPGDSGGPLEDGLNRAIGMVTAGSTVEQSLPADVESRLGSFTELVATAVANAESRAELTASRARIVAAADESRRRIERDLHDGAQQRLVHAVIVLKLALRALSNGDANAGELVTEALQHAEQANAELRELAHGILPAALTRGGLGAGVEALVSRASVAVSVDVSVERLPAGVEATAYFVISEALTNVVKHAHAEASRVTARVERGELRVEIRDDGAGGARGGEGAGLGGLEDRVSALDGRLVVESPPGGGTRVCAVLPIADPA